MSKLILHKVTKALNYCIVATALILLVFYTRQGIPGPLFVVMVIVQWGLFFPGCVFFLAGILLQWRRKLPAAGMLRWFDPSYRLGYVFIATANIWMELLAAILFWKGLVEDIMMTVMLPNLFIGLLLFLEVVLMGVRPKEG